MSNKILVASANTGTGLWTSICVGLLVSILKKPEAGVKSEDDDSLL